MLKGGGDETHSQGDARLTSPSGARKKKRGEVLIAIVVTPDMMDKLGIAQDLPEAALKLEVTEALLRLIDAQQTST